MTLSFCIDFKVPVAYCFNTRWRPQSRGKCIAIRPFCRFRLETQDWKVVESYFGYSVLSDHIKGKWVGTGYGLTGGRHSSFQSRVFPVNHLHCILTTKPKQPTETMPEKKQNTAALCPWWKKQRDIKPKIKNKTQDMTEPGLVAVYDSTSKAEGQSLEAPPSWGPKCTIILIKLAGNVAQRNAYIPRTYTV